MEEAARPVGVRPLAEGVLNFDVSQAWGKIQGLVHGFASLMPNIVLGLVLFTISCLIAAWAKRIIVGFYHRRGRHENLGLVMGRLVQAGIILLNLLIALSVVLPSFNAKDLIQVLGISGVAIGFAFRDILQNFLAGILILLAEPFRVGEEIEVGDFNGVVQEIQTRATLLKTWDGYLLVIPSACIYTEKLTVLNAYEARRTNMEFAVGFRDDLDEARRLIVEVVRGVEGVLADPAPSAIYTGVAAQGVTVRALVDGLEARRRTRGEGQDHPGRRPPSQRERHRNRLPDAAGALPRPDRGGGRRPPTAARGLARGPGEVPRPRRIADALLKLAETDAPASADGQGVAPSNGAERGANARKGG